MAMSRANYIRFAHILAKNNVNWDSALVSDLCSYFQEDNASFDWDRFCLAIQKKRNYNLTPPTTGFRGINNDNKHTRTNASYHGD